MSKIPVLFVIMQTDNQANGGVESITTVIENLQGITPIIITQLDTPVNNRWRKAGAEVYVLPIPYKVGSSFSRSSLIDKWHRVKSWVNTNYQAYRLLRKTSCQVVHCNDGWGLWHTAFGARLIRASVIYNIRSVKPLEQQYGWYWQFYIRLAHHLLVLSKDMQCELLSNFSYLQRHQSRMTHIYSIVKFDRTTCPSPTEQTMLQNKLSLHQKEFKLGYIAAFRDAKAQLEFIKYVVPFLSQSDQSIQTFFIGDFDPRKNEYALLCQQEVERLRLVNHVNFLGFTQDIAEWYYALDLVVIASRYEGLARCMIEAIACGTPVVSFDVTSAREILEKNNCGAVIPQGDYDSLLDTILDLVENPDIRQKLGENGRTAAEHLFNAQTVITQYEALYHSFL